MWKDAAINDHIVPIAQLLIDNAPDGFASVVFVGSCVEGSEGVTASIHAPDGAITYHSNFFDFSSDLKRDLRLFHDAFLAHGEDWKAIRLEVSGDSDFDLQFEHDDPERWGD